MCISYYPACSSKVNTNLSSSSKQYPETKLGWKYGSQAYTFNRFTFFEAIDKIENCNLKYVGKSTTTIQNLGGGITKAGLSHKCSFKRRVP